MTTSSVLAPIPLLEGWRGQVVLAFCFFEMTQEAPWSDPATTNTVLLPFSPWLPFFLWMYSWILFKVTLIDWLILWVCLYVWVCTWTIYVQGSEDSLQDSVLTFHMGPEDWTQGVRPGCRHLYSVPSCRPTIGFFTAFSSAVTLEFIK